MKPLGFNKLLYGGFVLAGAVLAAGLAVEMTQPPPPPPAPMPAQRPAPVPTQLPTRAFQPATPVKVQTRSVGKAALKAAPSSTTAAPPPVYTPEPHAEAPVVRRKPFPTVAAARLNPPLLKPVPYEEPPEPPHHEEPADVADPPRRQVVLQPGMQIAVRLNQTLSSERAFPGATLQASLADPIVVDGLVIAEKGGRATVHVVDSPGTSSPIQLGLGEVQTADGQRVALPSEPWATPEARANDIPKAIGRELSAIIGAIAGNGKEKPENIHSQTVIRFRLASKVKITERQL